MTATTKVHVSVLGRILESLGVDPENLEQCASTDSYRVDFEQNFTVELQNMEDSACRISARIFSLGKSLQVQENQLKNALAIFSELLDYLPAGLSATVSDHDNCLRLCIEINETNNEILMKSFQDFVHLAFAYKQTYFKHKST